MKKKKRQCREGVRGESSQIEIISLDSIQSSQNGTEEQQVKSTKMYVQNVIVSENMSMCLAISLLI